MQLLYLTSVSPVPPYSGYQRRAHTLIDGLAQRHTVDVLSFVRTPAELKALQELKFICRNVDGVVGAVTRWWTVGLTLGSPLPYHVRNHQNREFRSKLKRLCSAHAFDAVISAKINFLPYFLPRVPARTPFLLVDQQAVETDVWQNLLKNDPRPHVRLFARYNLLRVQRFERRVYPYIDAAIAISDRDKQLTEALYPGAKVFAAPHGVDSAYFRPSPPESVSAKHLLFTGTRATRNVDALRFFRLQIWPEITRAVPDAHFCAIGDMSPEDVPFLMDDNRITVTGRVEDVRPYMDRGRIYVAPFRMGEGMKTKIVEALAMGKVVVSTPMGIQGIDVEPGAGVFVADGPMEFAQTVTRLMGDEPSAIERLGERGREIVLQRYSCDATVAKIERAIEELVAANGKDH